MPSPRFEHYVDQARIYHATSKAWTGKGSLRHSQALIDLSKTYECKHALDYGCGKGEQYRRLIVANGRRLSLEDILGYTVFKFDPGVPEYQTEPKMVFDLVWCTDVIEHIPEEDIDWFIDRLFALAGKALFVSVACYPSKKALPDGTNAHVTIKPKEWWREKFAEQERRRNFDVKLVLLVDG